MLHKRHNLTECATKKHNQGEFGLKDHYSIRHAFKQVVNSIERSQFILCVKLQSGTTKMLLLLDTVRRRFLSQTKIEPILTTTGLK